MEDVECHMIVRRSPPPKARALAKQRWAGARRQERTLVFCLYDLVLFQHPTFNNTYGLQQNSTPLSFFGGRAPPFLSLGTYRAVWRPLLFTTTSELLSVLSSV